MDLTAILKSSKDLEFQDVSYTVIERKHFVQETGRRKILDNVSGAFRNGQLSAIMGPSGAGKSSLLNAISGYKTSGVDGLISINKSSSAYITQEDHHQALLSVYELMRLSCALKLKNSDTFECIITEILINLNLDHRRDVVPERLSGGERKRLSIALELVSNPVMFFLDEPTSGLDEVTAAQCIRMLKNLAKDGRTIVCTIHQPSANILNIFDSLYVLARGKCVYQGIPGGIVPFLARSSLDCPTHYTPADYVIEICDSEDGKYIPFLSEVVQNGKLIYTPCTDSGSSDIALLNSKEFKNVLTMFYPEPMKTERSDSCFGGNVFLEKMKWFSKKMKHDSEAISTFTQFSVLLTMMLKKIIRNKVALWTQFAHHLLCGLLFGLIFFNAANEGNRMFDHLKYCIGTILVIVYTQVMVPVLNYPSEIKLVKREFFNRWYNLTSYYMAMMISRLPFQVIFNTMFLSCTYWMTGLPCQLWRFGLFLFIGLTTSIAAEGMGLAIGATFSVTNGAVMGPLIIAPLMGLAIYGFDFAKDIPLFMYVIMKLSYFRVGAVTMVLVVFGFDRHDLDCFDVYCHFANPKVLLQYLDIDKVSIWKELCFLIGALVFFRILIFLSLKRRCRT